MKANAPLTRGKPSEHTTLRLSRELQIAIDEVVPYGRRAGWMRLALIAALEVEGVDVTGLRAVEGQRLANVL